MPTVSFNITDRKYTNSAKAVSAFNTMHPESAVADTDAFAKHVFLVALGSYLGCYNTMRAQEYIQKMNVCSEKAWTQITGILAADVPDEN